MRLSGSGLWPFTSLQQAAFRGVVLAGLSSGANDADVTQSQIAIGAAKVGDPPARKWTWVVDEAAIGTAVGWIADKLLACEHSARVRLRPWHCS